MKVHAENSILQGNSAGGGMVVWNGGTLVCGGIWYATVTLTSTTFASNSAGDMYMVVVCIYKYNICIAVWWSCI